jgi:hypothetical protein
MIKILRVGDPGGTDTVLANASVLLEDPRRRLRPGDDPAAIRAVEAGARQRAVRGLLLY